jgi:preprotein translocase subunit YajC
VNAFLQLSSIIAQAPQPAGGDPPGLLSMLFPMMIILALFYFMMIRPQKRQQQDMRNMVHNLKENDRVVTIGGIYGVVTNVQRDADRVTLRVDESTGTRIKVGMSAIARVLTAEDAEIGASANKT